jgi:hypothetical protein
MVARCIPSAATGITAGGFDSKGSAATTLVVATDVSNPIVASMWDHRIGTFRMSQFYQEERESVNFPQEFQ